MTTAILPGESLGEGLVVTSVVSDDFTYPDTLWQVLLLMPTLGAHYRIAEVWEATRRVTLIRDYPNIVPAVEGYVENGGDY